ncbi:SHOCT domain-containing protein [Subsaximicrobium wynnwilliamsii]|uniref:SHOCT domain-containing protein n=1 Tax=Subsaximicrobium wynnwilliamsii TaxID=291179 RepID=A0A5C6ZLX8_9FLAO|nr:SHOCT domain-containing protein [Subsaximicrobium wynnwilliamsii]TXD85542.1 SHOCT domain-containing protein [Subsaximicrobium wynnwilliamsii]TXD90895.1 SHOCT domain-containing protein [Subsaximicrobium wynnwilliamsii]TXE05402.1 SHOCT domain-containing protein [Subsaximicrobium wynnwilliamsii]
MMMWWWILIPVLLVLGAVLYIRRNKENIRYRENPMAILDKRFAKGEINKEEFEEQKRTLNTKN